MYSLNSGYDYKKLTGDLSGVTAQQGTATSIDELTESIFSVTEQKKRSN